MLISILGDDLEKKKKKQKEVLKTLKQKRPNAVFELVNFTDLDIYKMKECINTASSFFDSKNIYLFSNIFLNKKTSEIFIKNLEDIKNSENAFILYEEKITKKDKNSGKEVKNKEYIEKIKKNSFNFFEYNKKVEKEFNIFSLTDAILNKNKKQIWLLFHSALKNKVDIEKIYSNIFFSFKTLYIVSLSIIEKESTLKPFPYLKAKRALANWNKQKLEDNFFKLILIHNKSRISESNFKNSLEKFILEI